MAKKKGMGGILDIVAWVVGIIVALGVGGLFVAGGFTGVVLLKLLPLIVHQIVGWIIIGSTLLGLVLKLIDMIS